VSWRALSCNPLLLLLLLLLLFAKCSVGEQQH
jgi:hypothetical protein